MTTEQASRSSGLRWALSDAAVMGWRNLLKYRRVPQLLIFSTVQPVVLVLLFNFVFVGAIGLAVSAAAPLLGTQFDYIDFLIPGVMIQASVFGSTQTGVGLADDMNKGLIERFRSLPMARSAVMLGRTIGDAARNTMVVLLIIAVGYLLGFQFRGGLFYSLMAIFVAVAFGISFSSISATVGLTIRDVESTQAAMFIWIFPLVFASSAFVPVASMPDWLQTFAEINPVSVSVNAIRAFTLGIDPWPDFWKAMAWIAGILAVFIPLAVSRYRKAV